VGNHLTVMILTAGLEDLLEHSMNAMRKPPWKSSFLSNRQQHTHQCQLPTAETQPVSCQGGWLKEE